MRNDVFRIEIFIEESMKLTKLRKQKKHTRRRKRTTITGLMKPFPMVPETVTPAGKSRLSGEPVHMSCKDQFL